jgi:hypothetical protein
MSWFRSISEFGIPCRQLSIIGCASDNIRTVGESKDLKGNEMSWFRSILEFGICLEFLQTQVTKPQYEAEQKINQQQYKSAGEEIGK